MQQQTTANDSNASWVLIYGIPPNDANAQAEVRKFVTQFGGIAETRRSSSSAHNWMAVKYNSMLCAEKALCHSDIRLSDGVTICGIKRLDERDPLLLVHSSKNFSSDLLFHPGGTGKLDADEGGGGGVAESGIASQQKQQTFSTVGDDERDIFLIYDDKKKTAAARAPNQQEQRSLCDKLLRWLLSIQD